MPKTVLKWKKRRDPHGTPIDLIARNGKDVYQVVFSGKKRKGPYSLTLNGLVQGTSDSKDGAKALATVLANPKKKVKVVLTPEQKRNQEVMDTFAALWWHFGPDFHLIHKVKNKILKQAGIRRKEVTPAVVHHAERASWTLLRNNDLPRPPVPENVEVKPRKYKRPKPPKPKEEVKLIVPKERPATLTYTGPRPPSRSRAKLQTIHGFSTHTKCPFKPKSTKTFKRIRQWAEKVRDCFQEKGVYASVYYLARALADIYKLDHEKQARALARLHAVYEEEFTLERQVILGMVKKSEAGEKLDQANEKGVRGGKDKWGFRVGSRAAKVNAVITDKGKSTKEIEAEIGEQRVLAHLRDLRKRKLIVKTKSQKWRLPK